MKNVNEIKNEEVRKEIIKLQGIFEDSFLNDELEFIAINSIYLQTIYGEKVIYKNKTYKVPKRPIWVNLYFLTSNISTKNEVKAKVLEYFSRDAHKTMFSSEIVDEMIHQHIRQCINFYLQTDFSEKDIELIYTHLGNGINRKKAIKFIESGYDMNILCDKEENNEK